MKISVVSGGFDPLHSGHIEYFKAAANLGDKLIVALNSDEWLKKKKGKVFLPFEERANIVSHLDMVDEVIDFKDDELGSCKDGIQKVIQKYPNGEVYFCNGGDRNKTNIPEMEIEGINFIFGVGGEHKKNSSSWILKNKSEKRVWGKLFNLFQDSKLKLKELIVAPGKGMSFQRHFLRNEIWFVSHGSCIVNYSKTGPKEAKEIHLSTNEIFHVNKEEWHQIINPNEKPCHIIEIQYGEKMIEEDIERHSYYSE